MAASDHPCHKHREPLLAGKSSPARTSKAKRMMLVLEEEEEDIRSGSWHYPTRVDREGGEGGWSGNNSLELIRSRQASTLLPPPPRLLSFRFVRLSGFVGWFRRLVLALRLSAVGQDDP